MTANYNWNKLFLIGFMGCGKTTLSKALAQHMGLSYLDTDECLVSQHQQSISEIFKNKGEANFRSMERSILEKVSQQTGTHVIATGGGLPCYNDNIDFMLSKGLVIYVRMKPDELTTRLWNERSHRPLISDFTEKNQLQNYIHDTLNKRELFYNKAHYVLDASVNLDENVIKLVRIIETHYNTIL